jgi:hypothetical protein
MDEARDRVIVSADGEPPAHPEMHHESVAAVDFADQILCPPTQRQQPAPLQSRNKPFWKGETQIPPALLDVCEAGTDHHRSEAPAHRLDFG